MNWIRIAANIGADPKVVLIGNVVGVGTPTAVGHIVLMLTGVGGSVPSGDLSNVPDDCIEVWAQWYGKGKKRGVFAGAVRAYLCNAEGVITAWDKYNGVAIRDNQRNKLRQKEWRERKREGTTVTPPVTVTSALRNSARYGTVRTTNYNNNNNSLCDDASAPPLPDLFPDQPAAAEITPQPRPKKPKRPTVAANKYPGFTPEDRAESHRLWTARVGAVDFGRLVKALGPCWQPDDTAACLAVVAKYVVALEGPKFAFGNKVERLADSFGAMLRIVRAQRDGTLDPYSALEEAQTLIHGRPVAASRSGYGA